MRIDSICQDVPDAEYAQADPLAHQKLECLGTLAGGIAHDVNNLLGAVLAQAELHGLGLSVVRAIVSSLGGAIQVSSEPAKGTAFWVLLPSAGIGT